MVPEKSVVTAVFAAHSIPQPQDVPLGVRVPVRVTYYEGPAKLFLRYTPPGSPEYPYENFCIDGERRSIYEAFVGMYCLVCHDGRMQEGLRAQIRDVHTNSSGLQALVRVFYVDVGREDFVELNCVFPIDAQATAEPRGTVECCLHRLRPTTKSSRFDLINMLPACNVSYEAIFHSVTEAGVYEVDLFTVCYTKRMGLTRVNVNEMLICNHYAKFLSYLYDTPVVDGSSAQISSRLALPASEGTSKMLDASVSTLSDCTHTPSDGSASCYELVVAEAPKGNSLEIKITYICTPVHWYGQLTSTLEDLSEVHRIISSSCTESACSEREVKKGSYFIYRDLPHEMGARVRVEEVLDVGKSRIFLIDHGNRKVVSSSCLFRMDKRLYLISPLALRFHLVGIRPWSEWTAAAVTAFEAFTLGDSPLTVEVLETQSCDDEFGDNIHLVKLFSKTHGSVAECMIRDGYARTQAERRETKTPPAQNADSGNMQLFDPMQDDYNDLLNSYGVNTDDPGVATSNFTVASGQKRICKFFSARGTCKQGKYCVYSHVAEEAGSALLHVNEPVPVLSRRVQPPEVGSRVIGQVSSCKSPGFFYLMFPYGTRPYEQLIIEGMDFKSPPSLESLMEEMQHKCSLGNFSEDRLFTKAAGELVAARSSHDKRWYRGQIVSIGHDTFLQVFFVDFGFCEWLPIMEVKALHKCFTHLPLQAYPACIVVDELGFSSDKTGWDTEMRQVFVDCVARKDVLVETVRILNGLLYVRLYVGKDDMLFDVADRLKAHRERLIKEQCQERSVFTRTHLAPF